MIKKNLFWYGGHLNPKEHFEVCIDRKKQTKKVLNGIEDRKYYAVLAPRQTGKTTFINQLINKINETAPITYVNISITLEDLRNVGKNEIYASIARKIIENLSYRYYIDPSSLLYKHEKIKSNLDLKNFFIEISEAKLACKSTENIITQEKEDHKYIIFMDEIGGIGEAALDFLWTIRAIHENRSEGFDRYSFIISGATDLLKLTRDKASPYNIAHIIDLEDFGREEITSMVRNALEKIGAHYYENFPEEVFEAANGHPYFTQKLCGTIIEDLMLDDLDDIRKGALSEHVDNLIEHFDPALGTTWKKVTNNNKIWEILQSILKGEQIRYNEYDEFFNELKLSGAIIRDKTGSCKIRNQIYNKFFKWQMDI